MLYRERNHEDETGKHGQTHGGAGGNDLNNMRQAGERFHSAADDAIRRALSGDSQAFLRANRQQGGQ